MIDNDYILRKLFDLHDRKNEFLLSNKEIKLFYSINQRIRLIEGTKSRMQSSLETRLIGNYKMAKFKLNGLEDCQTDKVICFVLFSESQILYVYTCYNMEKMIFSIVRDSAPMSTVIISEYKIWLKDIFENKVEIPPVMLNPSSSNFPDFKN
jgi:hypothetical protein